MEGVVTRAVFFRALAAVYLVALLSLWPQFEPLFGSDGVLPAVDYLARLADHLGIERFWRAPTLLWLWPSDAGVHALFAAGVALALALLWGTPLDGWVLLGMWAVYLSIATAAQLWLGYQWDSLLIEVTFCAALWAPFLPGPVRPPPTWARWLLYWVVFKLFFFAGLVKLTSGDPTWRDGTALTYHYWTQPLPNPVSWYADRLPDALHAFSQWAMFAIELVVPFGIALGARARRVVFFPLVLLMGLLALTGNYGWFQLLSVVLCLVLIDDAAWRRVLPSALLDRVPEARAAPRHLGLPVAALLFLTSLLFAAGYDALPPWGQAWARAAWPFRTANSYGLFAVMTTERPVVVFEMSEDGARWEPIWPRYQTGPVDRMPPQVAPHMPRLDWQLWFAALGDCRSAPWVLKVQVMLAQGHPGVWRLFATERPATFPRHVRTTRWMYRFAEPGSDDWWVREYAGPFCPTVPPVRGM